MRKQMGCRKHGSDSTEAVNCSRQDQPRQGGDVAEQGIKIELGDELGD